MIKNIDDESLDEPSIVVTLLEDDRDFILKTLQRLLSENLLKRIQRSPVEKNRCVRCNLSLRELRKIIYSLFTIAHEDEDIQEDASRIAERLRVYEYEIIEKRKENETVKK